MKPEEKAILSLARDYFRQLAELGEREVWVHRKERKGKGILGSEGQTKGEVVLREPISPYVSSPGAALEAFRLQIKDCRKCSLSRTRKRFVFGEGNPQARLVFIGEAPGAEEDLAGRPFVGAAGQLLTKIIENGLEMKRGEVFIGNILKCRPPGNRNPLPEEIEQCEPHLIRQLEIIQPRIICALGTFAAQTLLRTKVAISALRGNIHYYQDIKVIPTYHPAALLRNPGWKRLVWEDIQLLHKEYDRESR